MKNNPFETLNSPIFPPPPACCHCLSAYIYKCMQQHLGKDCTPCSTMCVQYLSPQFRPNWQMTFSTVEYTGMYSSGFPATMVTNKPAVSQPTAQSMMAPRMLPPTAMVPPVPVRASLEASSMNMTATDIEIDKHLDSTTLAPYTNSIWSWNPQNVQSQNLPAVTAPIQQQQQQNDQRFQISPVYTLPNFPTTQQASFPSIQAPTFQPRQPFSQEQQHSLPT